MNKYQIAFNEVKEHLTNKTHWWSTQDERNHLATLQELVDKESKYKALEEELGISLPILFKAFKQGVQGYKSIESLYYDEESKMWYIECIYKYGDYGIHYTDTLALKDYGKTWWLKEDLKSE